MARYAGEIKISAKSGFFVNFYPGYRIVDDRFVYLSEDDLDDLLANSQYLNINLVSTSTSLDLQEFFTDGEDVILDFSISQLQPNLKSDGSRYPTAWKLDVSRLGPSAIHHMEDFGWYYLPELELLPENWQQQEIYELSNANISEGMDIVLPVAGAGNLLVGPFRVHFDERTERLYVRIKTDSKRHLISGFRFARDYMRSLLTLEQEDVTRDYIRLKGAEIEETAFDLISDQELLENFAEILRRRNTLRQQAPEEDTIRHMLDVYHSSVITSQGLPKEISRSRKERLAAMFDARDGYDDALKTIGEVAGSLLENFQKEPLYSSLLDTLASSEDFLSRLDTFDPLRRRRQSLESEIESLSQEKAQLEEKADELRRLDPASQLEAYHQEIERLDAQRAQAEEALTRSLARANISQNIEDLESRAAWLQQEIETRSRKIQTLDGQVAAVESRLDGMLEQAGERALELSFDNLISARFAAQSAAAMRREEIEGFRQAAGLLKHVEHSYFEPAQLVDYLIGAMKAVRPYYSRNEILNLLICFSQGFLTIFTGGPGTGKTSLARHLAASLGLNETSGLQAQHPSLPSTSRFVQVSVERGWTSRRDWIGFYNSLTSSFDKSSAPVYDLLSILDQEARSTLYATDLPALILLDDANLSSMEYYWADFMSMGEEDEVRGVLQMAQDYQFQIPSSLHFCATVQNDHTTEPLSARLLDRAWVISLSRRRMPFADLPSFVRPSGQIITQSQLAAAFQPENSDLYLPQDLEELLQTVTAQFSRVRLDLSTRSEIAIRRYVQSALAWFEDESEMRPAGIAAMDFAIAQRLLPTISGSSERFRKWLEQLASIFENAHLDQCHALVEGIMEKGDSSMQFYQFFG